MKKDYDKDFYMRFRKFVVMFMKTFYNIEINGQENIPTEGNYLLSGNHLNILDAWLLMLATDDELRFMVDKKLYRYDLWESFFTKLGTFSIDPDNFDIAAIKQTLGLLNDGENVVIFPEGKTHKPTEEVPFKAGIPKISVMAKTVVVPFGIRGSYVPGSTITLNIGSPINFKIADIKRNEYDSYLEKEVRLLEKK